MRARQITLRGFVAAVTAAALAALAAGPTASARLRVPDPKLPSGKRVAKTPARAQSSTREIVSLGYDSYSGLELFAVKVNGQFVGMPFG